MAAPHRVAFEGDAPHNPLRNTLFYQNIFDSAAGDMKVLFRTLGVVCALAALVAAGRTGDAQSWGWGGGYNRGYESPPPYGDRVYGQQGYDNSPSQPRPSFGSTNPRCRELEYQLTSGGSPNNAQDQLPRIDADMRQADAQYHRVQSDAEHSACYEEMFFFGRSLRRTPRCIDLDSQVQAAKARLQQLRTQRDALTRVSSPRSRHDEIVAELARNRCGDNYVREYEAQRSRSNSIFSFFSNEESEDSSRYTAPSYGSSSSYRTLCVRECDGFYFPISNETTESHFQEDDAKCRSQCAAPAELFYHRADQDVDQMVSLGGRPYSQTPNAFRNRKVYIRGCSCNQNEFSREEIAKSEEALKTSKRADASPAKPVSDAAFARRISQAVQNAPGARPAAPSASDAAPPAAPPAAPVTAEQPATAPARQD